MAALPSMRRLLLAAALALGAAACGGGGGGGGGEAGGGGAASTAGPEPSAPAPAPVAATADIRLLFMGNSHSSVNELPAMVAAMVRAAKPGKTVVAVEAPGWMFLEERAADAASLALLNGQPWSSVILQAQKYSTSGLFDYSTAGAESLVRAARAGQALPILFPEWPRLGVDETQRIYDLHVRIAEATPACVAPIGQAWDLAAAQHPTLVLHASDGNHSAPAGAFLAALVLASTFTRAPPDQVPFLAGFPVDADTQDKLRHVAAQAVARFPPRRACPADA